MNLDFFELAMMSMIPRSTIACGDLQVETSAELETHNYILFYHSFNLFIETQ
jgi:hypothetical protein